MKSSLYVSFQAQAETRNLELYSGLTEMQVFEPSPTASQGTSYQEAGLGVDSWD